MFLYFLCHLEGSVLYCAAHSYRKSCKPLMISLEVRSCFNLPAIDTADVNDYVTCCCLFQRQPEALDSLP